MQESSGASIRPASSGPIAISGACQRDYRGRHSGRKVIRPPAKVSEGPESTEEPLSNHCKHVSDAATTSRTSSLDISPSATNGSHELAATNGGGCSDGGGKEAEVGQAWHDQLFPALHVHPLASKLPNCGSLIPTSQLLAPSRPDCTPSPYPGNPSRPSCKPCPYLGKPRPILNAVLI